MQATTGFQDTCTRVYDPCRKIRDVDCVIEVHDARIPFSGRNLTFRDVVGGARPHLLVLNKADLIPESDQEAIRKESMRQSPHISRVLFTDCRHHSNGVKTCRRRGQMAPSRASRQHFACGWHSQCWEEQSHQQIEIRSPEGGRQTCASWCQTRVDKINL